jgi:hypothetical protein
MKRMLIVLVTATLLATAPALVAQMRGSGGTGQSPSSGGGMQGGPGQQGMGAGGQQGMGSGRQGMSSRGRRVITELERIGDLLLGTATCGR